MLDHTGGLEKQIRTLRKRSLFTLFLTWLALFFTIVGIAAGYKNFLRVHDKANQARDDAKVAMVLMPQMASKRSVDSWQNDIRMQLMATQAQSSKELDELKILKNRNTYIEAALQQQVEQLTRQQQLLKSSSLAPTALPANYWQVTEIRYLLKVASRHLNLNQDATTAITALMAADDELMALGIMSLLPIRGLIAKDVANLQEYQSVDIASVISAVDQLAARLTPNAADGVAGDEVMSSAFENNLTKQTVDADSILNRMRARLDETVIIKRYDNKLAKTIKGDTQQVRYELIRLKLETLKLLVLKSQYSVYQDQLQKLSLLLRQEHIDLIDNRALVALANLESIDLQAKLPTLFAGQLLDELLAGGVAKVQP